MIAFVSLFLGLFIGPKPVELAVGGEVAVKVAAVELRLDGATVATLTGAPWKTEVDFGSELAPRLLEAVALDGEQRELGRASQWLNLPQPKVVTSVVVDPPRAGAPRVARLAWESTAGAQPKKVVASLDDQPLTVTDPRQIVLPPVDEAQMHLLHVEMRFEEGVTSRLDVTFGGQYAEEVSTENTALPIVALDGKKRAPTAAAAQGWFRKGSEPLRVISIEKAAAEIVVVMARPFPRFFAPTVNYKIPKALELPEKVEVRFLATQPEETSGVASTFNLFPSSPAYGRDTADLYHLLTGLLKPPEERPSRPSAAMAVGGLLAFESRRRRAVVYVPGSEREPADALTPAVVRRYLERLHVPIVVWDPEKTPAAHLGEWGEARSVGSLEKLANAFDELKKELDRQWIVWLDGRHLPQEVTLTPAAEGFALLR